MSWTTHDGYEFEDEIKEDEVKSFFGGGRREREESTRRNANDITGRTATENDNGIRRSAVEDKPVSRSESEGSTAGKD